jgi:CRP-like cAMP-binding protein
MSAIPEEAPTLKELFIHQGTQYAYRKGEFVIRPGEQPSGIFYIESGLVKAYDITKYGEENILIIRKPDEFFPFIWSITGEERSIIYEALVPTVVRRVRREEFIAYVDNNPDLLRSLLDIAIDMYRIHSERILNLGYRNVRERLVSYLLSTAGRFGKVADEGQILLDVPLRYQDIGSAISASRETIGREIQSLERQGLVVSRDGYLVLIDPEALQNLL